MRNDKPGLSGIFISRALALILALLLVFVFVPPGVMLFLFFLVFFTRIGKYILLTLPRKPFYQPAAQTLRGPPLFL